MIRALGHLATSVSDGSLVAFRDMKVKGGRDFWTYLNQEPAQGEQFNRAMTAIDSILAPGMVADGPFRDRKVGVMDRLTLQSKLLRTILFITKTLKVT